MRDGEFTLYRRCTPVVDATVERENGELPTKVIVDAVAEAEDTSPLDLPPLYEFVDPDVIEKLLDERTDRGAVLGFRMAGWVVFVRADGRVRVCDSSRPTDPEPVFDGQPA